MTWFTIVIITIVAYRLLQKFWSFAQKPYGWSCDHPGCTFSLRSSDKEGVERLKEVHLNASHGGP